MSDKESIMEMEVKNFKSDCAEIWTTDIPFDLFLVGGVLQGTVSVIGIFGNILTILVLTRSTMKSSTNILLLSLSICDLLFVTANILYGFPVLFQYLRVWKEYITTLHPVIFTYLRPILESSQVGSVYFTIAVSLERFVVVRFPLQARTYCTIQNAVRTSIIIVGFAVLFAFPVWWENSYVDRYVNGTWVCYQTVPDLERYPDYVLYYQNWASFFVFRLIPYTSLSILNWNIYKKLREAELSRQTMTISESNENSIAKMLLCVVLVFLACNSVRLFYRLKEAIFDGGTTDTPVIYERVATLFINLNSAVNFIIYCLMGTKFRRTCIGLFCSSSMRNRTRRMGTDGSMTMTSSMNMSNTSTLTIENSV